MKLSDAMEYARDYATVDAWRSRTLRMPLQRSTEILARLRAEVNRLTARLERDAGTVAVPMDLLARLAQYALCEGSHVFADMIEDGYEARRLAGGGARGEGEKQ